MGWFGGFLFGRVSGRQLPGAPTATAGTAPRLQCPPDDHNWAEGAKKLDERQLQALLKEYEMSWSWCNRLEAVAWSMMAAVPLAVLVGISSILARSAKLGAVLSIGALVLIFFFVIFLGRAQERWRDFLRVHNYRRQEIEQGLGLYADRYVDWMDAIAKGKHVSVGVADERNFEALKEYFAEDLGVRRKQRNDRRAGFHPGWGHSARRRMTCLALCAAVIAIVVSVVSTILPRQSSRMPLLPRWCVTDTDASPKVLDKATPHSKGDTTP